MTPQKEQQLLQSLYDRLFDAITYVPGGGKTNVFEKSTSFIQFSKNEALNPKDFQNAMSPLNPGGDAKGALAFSTMVDQVPTVSADFTPSGKKVSETYKLIVDNANTDNKVDGPQKATYDKAYKFLNTEQSIENFDGPPTVTTKPTPIAQTYDDNQAAYVTAYSGYRTAQNGYDFDKIEDQRAWNAVAPALQLNVDRAWTQWIRGGKQNVERAQQALSTTINDAISAAILQAQNSMSDSRWMAPLPGGDRWMLSYALPSDWAFGGSGGTQFSLKSSFLKTEQDSSFTSYGGGAAWNAGLWSVGGSFASSSESSNFHMDANNVEISAKLQTVRIMRPWLNPILFTMSDWWMKGNEVDNISNGGLSGNEDSVLPLIPSAIVVASDVTIKADFSEQDKTHIAKAVSGSARVGWGPFSIGGNYSHSSTNDTFEATTEGGTIRVPGIQTIAWVSTMTPPSPPVAAPAN